VQRPVLNYNLFSNPNISLQLDSRIVDRNLPVNARFNYWGATDEFVVSVRGALSLLMSLFNLGTKIKIIKQIIKTNETKLFLQ
jgi:hypothetical protein